MRRLVLFCDKRHFKAKFDHFIKKKECNLANLYFHIKKCARAFSVCRVCLKIRHCMFLNI